MVNAATVLFIQNGRHVLYQIVLFCISETSVHVDTVRFVAL
jgi:hypothetical protein